MFVGVVGVAETAMWQGAHKNPVSTLEVAISAADEVVGNAAAGVVSGIGHFQFSGDYAVRWVNDHAWLHIGMAIWGGINDAAGKKKSEGARNYEQCFFH
jgi:hypothetical protein